MQAIRGDICEVLILSKGVYLWVRNYEEAELFVVLADSQEYEFPKAVATGCGYC